MAEDQNESSKPQKSRGHDKRKIGALKTSSLGPIFILLLELSFGPCIINKLIAFVKDRISAVQLVVLRQSKDQERKNMS